MNEVIDFIAGQSDCKDGVEHQNKSEHYNRGYAAQFELEQLLTNRSENEQS